MPGPVAVPPVDPVVEWRERVRSDRAAEAMRATGHQNQASQRHAAASTNGQGARPVLTGVH